MRGKSALFIAIAAVALILLIAVSLCKPPRPQNGAPGKPLTTEIVHNDEPVTFCVDRTVNIPRGRVQILVDASGSMRGVREPVINYVRWLEHAVSRLRESSIAVDAFRIGGFEKKHGIVTFGSIAEFARGYQPQSNTTLHEAIRQSGDWDLTFIITDGVAAAGAGSGDCATGVDAACVARAFRDAVYLERTTAVEPQPPGIWVIPLWTRHSGPFYSERPVAVAEFDREASLESIHRELEQDVSIVQPRSDPDGNLMFDYTGPRALMLIVIAHSADLGRTAIVALRERMAENNVVPVDGTRANAAGLGAFAALELYPGYLPRIEWTSLAENDETPPRGTMDVDFLDRKRISIACQSQSTNAGSYVLASKPIQPGRRCVAIHQLPAFELGLLGAGDSGPEVGSFIADFRREARSEGDQFTFTLLCGQQPERPCASSAVRAQWVARPRYDQSTVSGSEAPASIKTLSTTDLTTQPHRLYGFESLLSYFYDEVAKDKRQIVMADLELCHRTETK